MRGKGTGQTTRDEHENSYLRSKPEAVEGGPQKGANSLVLSDLISKADPLKPYMALLSVDEVRRARFKCNPNQGSLHAGRLDHRSIPKYDDVNLSRRTVAVSRLLIGFRGFAAQPVRSTC